MKEKIVVLREGLFKLQRRQIYLESEIDRRAKSLAAGDTTYSKEGWERQLVVLKKECDKNWLDAVNLKQQLAIEEEHKKMSEERDKKMVAMVEADRVLVLKRQLLSEFLKGLNLEGGEDWWQQLETFLAEREVEEKVRVNILGSLDDAQKMLKEMEAQGKHVPRATERENVGEILYWAKQG